MGLKSDFGMVCGAKPALEVSELRSNFFNALIPPSSWLSFSLEMYLNK